MYMYITKTGLLSEILHIHMYRHNVNIHMHVHVHTVIRYMYKLTTAQDLSMYSKLPMLAMHTTCTRTLAKMSDNNRASTSMQRNPLNSIYTCSIRYMAQPCTIIRRLTKDTCTYLPPMLLF